MVSVIIPSVKGDEMLEDCIRAVRYSSYKYVEVIVVCEGLERSAQRNLGLERANGRYILILDSDQMVHPKLIEECVGLMEQGYGAVYIPEIITTPGFFGRLRNWERRFYTGTAVDVVRCVRRGCPKFDEKMSGPEDSDWDRRVNGLRKVATYPVFHHDNVGFIQYLKKKIYYTKSMGEFEKKNPGDKVLDWKWRCFGVFVEREKWRNIIAKPHLFICLVGLILIRGIVYVTNKNV